MSNFDDEPTFEDETPPEESSNRTFLLAAGVLGAIILLALLCGVGYILFTRNSSAQAEQVALRQATNQAATIQVGLTSTARVQALAATAAVTNTLPPTNTPVIAQPTTTPSPTQNPATATVGVLEIPQRDEMRTFLRLLASEPAELASERGERILRHMKSKGAHFIACGVSTKDQLHRMGISCQEGSRKCWKSGIGR